MAHLSERDISSEYFHWLLDIVRVEENGRTNYSMMLSQLYEIDFIWSVANDDNRAKDGLDLRDRFFSELYSCQPVEVFFNKDCSVLEMLIALAIRCEEDIMGEPGDDNPDRWFWLMIDNLGLNEDDDSNFEVTKCEEKVTKFLLRRYDGDGNGGIFPLRESKNDQRNVEIWFQMCEFLEENFSILG